MHEPELTRAIGLWRATALVVGTIIGASIFVQPSEVTALMPSVGGIFLVWLASGVLTLCGALVCAELASVFPKSGGVYVFLRESFGQPLAFLWGWAMFWTMHSGIIAVIAMAFARYLAFIIPMDELGQELAAVALILLLSVVNALGVRQGSALQTTLTAFKLLAIVAIIGVGFTFGGGNPDAALRNEPLLDLSDFSLHHFAVAMVAGLFAFGGWHMVTYSAGETIDPRRTIPRALVVGTLIVTACYVALNAVYLFVLPLETVAASQAPAAGAAEHVLGRSAGVAITILVLVSTSGSVAGIILAGPRVYHAMAHDGVIFRRLGNVHPRWRTPVAVIAAQAVWSSFLMVTGTYREVFRRVVYTEWIFFGLMAIGLMLLRRRTDLRRTYSVWGYPVIPILFAAASFAIVANEVYSNPRESLTGLSFVILGLPVYYLWTYFSDRQRSDP